MNDLEKLEEIERERVRKFIEHIDWELVDQFDRTESKIQILIILHYILMTFCFVIGEIGFFIGMFLLSSLYLNYLKLQSIKLIKRMELSGLGSSKE